MTESEKNFEMPYRVPPRKKMAPRAYVVQAIRNGISNQAFLPGQRLPSEKLLGEWLSVSRVTIRAAIAELEVAGELIRRKKSGCFVCERRKTVDRLFADTVVVLSTGKEMVWDEKTRNEVKGYSSQLDLGVSNAVAARGLHLFHLQLDRVLAADAVLQQFRKHPPKALLFTGAINVPQQVPQGLPLWLHAFLEDLAQSGVPVVLVGEELDIQGASRVVHDSADGARQLVEFLALRGRQRVLRLWSDNPDFKWLQRRNEGYSAAVAKLGLCDLPPADLSIVRPWISGDTADFERFAREAAGLLAPHLLGEDPVDALMVSSDYQYYGCAAACRLLGKEPGVDVDIAGYDNYWASLSLAKEFSAAPVATIDKHNDKIGAALLKLALESPQSPRLEYIPGSCVIPK